MNFLRADIDRAIVMTQYDLRGFSHPLGCRFKKAESAKSLDATTANFMAFAAGVDHGEPTDKNYIRYFRSSFEDYLAMCKHLAECCDASQREAIQLIIQEIVKQSKEMKAEVAAGKRKPSPYLRPLEKNNPWGGAVLALAEAFSQ